MGIKAKVIFLILFLIHLASFYSVINIKTSLAAEVGYKVGVDYHATGESFYTTSFIIDYHIPEVRAEVIRQIQSMVNDGVSIIHTRLWFSDAADHRVASKARLGFPPTAQELANIRAYVQDVSQIKNAQGIYVDLYMSPFAHGCGLFSLANADICAEKTFDQLMTTYKRIYVDFFNAIDVQRPDGTKAVKKSYILGELLPGREENFDNAVKILWPYFIPLAEAKGIEPTIYFIALTNEDDIFNDQYVDVDFPILNNHKSMYWIYRGVNFLRTNNLRVPQRIDFSFYPIVGPRGLGASVYRVISDAVAVFPNYQIGVAETSYPKDQTVRKQLGQAFTAASRNYPQFKELTFWTTPNSDGVNASGFPFDIGAYYGAVNSDLNSNGKVDIYDYNSLVQFFGRPYTIYDYTSLVTNFTK